MTSESLPTAPSIFASLDPDAMTRQITDEILAADETYAERTVPRDLLDAVTKDNVVALLVALDGCPLDLTPARRVGALKAELGISLAGVLHAYRIAGLTLWHEVGNLRVQDADGDYFDVGLKVWSFLDQLSTAAAEAHREVTESRGRWAAQARISAALELLDGVADAPSREYAAGVLGLSEPARFVVVATDRQSDERPHNHGRRLDHDDELVQWVDRGGLRMGIADLSGQRKPEAWVPNGAGRFGLSAEFAFLSDAPAAARQATVALRSAGRDGAGVVRYGERPVETLLVSTPGASTEAADQILAGLDGLPADDREVLLDTVAAWIDVDGSTAAAAQRLHCHRNTVLYRLRRVETLTGRSVARPSDVVALGIAVLVRSHVSPAEISA
ncbi:helix-turn-helix domain-containing protein [Gordonia sp. X0973]|uniref:PucR family transcriptional regulator n=1 Tax=Gordonia sp. X0973 TaxID=2742602 RepID=UPI0013EB0FE9|nr:PucR family transcriptional regulator [Gordonia sp. X0973]QKT08637.1 helix-turn-helix domain-containing protein [Gordonia sp. X0973]